MKYLPITALILGALAVDGFAQTAHVAYSPGGFVSCIDKGLPNTACSPTVTQMVGYTPLPSGFISTAGTVLGAHALDQEHDMLYVTDGFTVFVCATNLYAPTQCGGGPPISSSFPVPVGMVMPSGLPFGGATGMCVGHGVWTTSPSTPCTDVLFMTNGIWVIAIDVRPPNSLVIGPWFATGVLPQVLTGLEYEDTPGVDYLWACDGVGNTFIYTTNGVPAAGPLPVLGPPPIPPVTGNVLDRSTCPPGHWVTNGQNLYPSVNPNPTIPLNPPAVIGLCFGASASAEPVYMPGRCGTSCNPAPFITTTEPICDGKNITFVLSSAAPNQNAMFVADTVCVPGGFGIFGCTWWMTFGPWPVVVNTITNPSGFAFAGPFPLPSATCPGLVGIVGYAQWVFIDPCPGGNGFGMTDALHMRLSTF